MAKKRSWVSKLLHVNDKGPSWLHELVTGSLFRVSNMRNEESINTIKSKIDTMRALAEDAQIQTALSYYATDATIVNTKGQILWATAIDDQTTEVADTVNSLIKRWEINKYARDHILELATVGNLYIPTTNLFKNERHVNKGGRRVALDNNTIPESDFDIVPCYKIPPESIIHLYEGGQSIGYLYEPDGNLSTSVDLHPDISAIHFSLGGLLGDYIIEVRDRNGDDIQYDIKFAEPLMSKATQPTQTLNLLEDANILSSLARTIKFINVECGTAEETEIQEILQNIKQVIEQNISINTNTGDAQSYVNPQSPNNLIYLPRIKGENAIDITDLNMADNTETDNKLLEYYQDKKLSVLGVPKEALNFSSNEGLGGAGSVLSQRSAIYANSLQRLKTAYIEGWTDAINMYCRERGYSGIVGKFELHMAEIITTQSTIQFEKRDAAVSQAQAIVELLKSVGVKDVQKYKDAVIEILGDVLPGISGEVNKWDVNIENGGDDNLGI